MNTVKWKIDVKELEKAYINGARRWNKFRMQREVDAEKYFAGFSYPKEKKMFEDQLKDLEISYKNALRSVNARMEEVLPALIHYMDEFVTLYKKNEEFDEKLERLFEKMGKKPECEGKCDDEC